MKINKTHSFFRLLALPAVTLVAATLLAPGAGHASEADPVTLLPPLTITQPPVIGYVQAPGALTTPPPPSRPDPSQGLAANKYLDSGYSNLVFLSDSSVKVFSQTIAKPAASKNGLAVYLQRWSGNGWVNVSSLKTVVSAGTQSSLNYSTTVTKGFYYRVKSDHWSTNGETREEFSTYSKTVLVEKE